MRISVNNAMMNANQFYLAGNLLVYALTVVMSCRASVRRFEAVDM